MRERKFGACRPLRVQVRNEMTGVLWSTQLEQVISDFVVQQGPCAGFFAGNQESAERSAKFGSDTLEEAPFPFSWWTGNTLLGPWAQALGRQVLGV